MSGGEILRSFAFLYSQTKDPQWLQRARLVAEYYWRSHHPVTNLIPNRPNAGSSRFDGSHFDTSITACLCPCLLDASDWTGDGAFREQALAYLKAYAKYGYDTAEGKYWGSLQLDGTPVPGPRERSGYAQYEPRGHVDLWQPYAAGYEQPLPTAIVYADVCLAGRDEQLVAAAQRWAAWIRRSWPPIQCEEQSWYAAYAQSWAPQGTYAGYYGQTISFFLRMHELEPDAGHREFAQAVAREAVAKLFHQGLFRGHPAKPYYESMDGVGDLLCALLELDSPSQR
jgi:hypothetical protein